MFLNKSRVWLLTAEHRHIPKTNVGGEGKRSLLSCCIILGNKSFTGSKLLSSTKHRRKLFLKRFYLFILRERGREREREGEKHQCVVASYTPLNGDLAHNLSMCPDWKLNQQPFASQACAQSTELHQLGQKKTFFPKKTETQNHAQKPHSIVFCPWEHDFARGGPLTSGFLESMHIARCSSPHCSFLHW